MVAQVKQEMFGSCTNIGECEAVCPKEIKLEVIARMNRDYLRASWTEPRRSSSRDEIGNICIGGSCGSEGCEDRSAIGKTWSSDSRHWARQHDVHRRR